MSNFENPFKDFVFSLPEDKLDFLIECINNRKDYDLYGVTNLEDAAIKYGRKPMCPKCSCENYIENGHTPAYHKRFKCENCGCSYTLLSDSVFNSSKISFHKILKYIQLMTFNVPLQQCIEVLEISSNTANLWRNKIFQTVNGYQDTLQLSGRIWIDETYIEDYNVLGSDYINQKPRGLSKTQICIVVAIDSNKNMVAIICGHGKPSSDRIYKTLHNHIRSNSIIVHDGEKAHNKLIRELNLKSEVYKANTKDSSYFEKMGLINNMCSWIKRYIWRFIGMDVENLQTYLNWFIYLQRCKRDNDKWPKSERILRHLILERTRYTRK